MGDPTLYDEDILLWSEQQAAAIRRLRQSRRDIPNELDIDNVAEEIEGVGRSELAAVESHIRLIFVHLIKLVVEPESDAARHWRGEIIAFHSEIRRRYSASMRQRIDLDALWRSAIEQSLATHEGVQQQQVAALPRGAGFDLDELVGEGIDSAGLTARLRRTGR